MGADNGPDLPSGIGAPATRAFAAAGLERLEQFSELTEADVLALHGVGPKAIRVLRAAMLEIGIDLAAK